MPPEGFVVAYRDELDATFEIEVPDLEDLRDTLDRMHRMLDLKVLAVWSAADPLALRWDCTAPAVPAS